MFIESVQAVAGLGGADVTDVVANTIGAGFGVAAGEVATKGIDRSGGSEHPPLTARRRGIVAAGVGFAVVAVLFALLAGADRRQARIHDELENAFADTSYDDLAAVLLGDPAEPDGSDPDARFTTASRSSALSRCAPTVSATATTRSTCDGRRCSSGFGDVSS